MLPRAFLGVLAITLMMTLALVSPSHADTTFDVAFTATGFVPQFDIIDVSGEFIATFDPTGSVSNGTATIVSMSGLPSDYQPLGDYDYSQYGGGFLTLNITYGSGYIFRLVTSGYAYDPAQTIFIEATGGLGEISKTGSASFVPLPPGFVLLGSGLLGLGAVGWRRRRS
jgi:hypothetical protein